MKKLNIIMICLLGSLLLFSICGFIFIDNFFDLKLSNVLSSAIAIGFAFYLTRLFTDKDRKRQEIVKLIDDIIRVLVDPKLRVFNDKDDVRNLTMQIRNIRNQMGIIDKVRKGYISDNDYNYIMEYIDNYDEVISEKMSKINELSGSVMIQKFLDSCVIKLKNCKYDILFKK